MRRRMWLQASIVLAALILLVPGVGGAAQGGPPYTDSDSYESCSDLFGTDTLAECSATATADHVTGAIGIDLSVASPLGGALPGWGSASGSGYLSHVVSTKKESPTVVVIVTVHVGSAEALAEGPTGGGSGYVDLYASASAFSCSCYAGEWRFLVDSYSSDPVSDVDIVVPLALSDYEGGPVAPGPIRVSVGISGYGSVGPFPGTAAALADVAVTSIEIG